MGATPFPRVCGGDGGAWRRRRAESGGGRAAAELAGGGGEQKEGQPVRAGPVERVGAVRPMRACFRCGYALPLPPLLSCRLPLCH